ncbi:LytTR family DNA-binding domain-containing protein [Caulobacter mirabilis]|uniref:LytTR family DNA-binding domain-containing protein n=1 Tax=Caulobacter mirabilis TaxID=69666 RepID=UPI001FEC97A3|nr:LytTR family DNA-binding domain-containing protein [Caulobacter mirabilis]
MKRLPTATWVWAFTAYSWLATTVSAAWFARRADPDLGVGASLLWQGSIYAAWLPAAGLVWLLLRRFGGGAGGLAALIMAGLVCIPLEAFVASLIDAGMAGRTGDLAARTLARLPVAILLYTAIVAVALAAAHHRRAREAQARADDLSALLSTARAAQTEATPSPRLLVSLGGRRAAIDTAEIEWLGAAGNYVVVHWAGREGLIRETLQTLADRLDPAVFARCHRSTLVNLARVKTAQPLSDGAWRLTLESGAELVASRTYRDAILRRLKGEATPAG